MPVCTARERLTLGPDYCGPAKLPVCSDSEPGSCAHWRSRANLVRDAFSDAFSAYEAHAWGKDELRPLSNTSRDNWGGFAVTMVDSLDTMLLMGLNGPYERSRRWLLDHLPSRLERDIEVPFFELSIRVLGGLLGAHTLTGDAELLALAARAGRKLHRAFDSPSGVPWCSVHLTSGAGSCPQSDFGESVPLAELGTTQLEFAALAAALGEPRFADVADGAIGALRRIPARRGLYPTRVRPRTASPASRAVGLGAGADSFYEALLKRWLQSGGAEPRPLRMYRAALGGLTDLVRRSAPSGLLFVGSEDLGEVGMPPAVRMRSGLQHDHLQCFLPGLLALGAPHGGAALNESATWALARGLLDTCWTLYSRQPSGLGPERVVFSTEESRAAAGRHDAERAALEQRARARRAGGGAPPRGADDIALGLGPKPASALVEDDDFRVLDAQWPLRPEFVESLYVMWRLEPDVSRRNEYRERGWAVFEALERWAKVEAGGAYASLLAVDVASPRQHNVLESFFFAETLKYLFLLFSDADALPYDLSGLILTTEAHFVPAAPLRPGAADDADGSDEDDAPVGVERWPKWWRE